MVFLMIMIEPVKDIEILMKLRKEKAYGVQHDYFDNPNYIGWTREGDENHLRSGLAVVITNRGAGEKRMYMGIQNAGNTYIDALEIVKRKLKFLRMDLELLKYLKNLYLYGLKNKNIL